jgi:hypothetical protein
MTSLSGKNNLIEDILEKAGAIHTLQSFRMKAWYSSQGNFATDLAELFEIEKILRKLYQLEIVSKNELMKTLDNTIEESDGAIEILQGSLQYVGRAYWATERMWWEQRKNFCPGPVFRGFDLWRSHPRWYLHRALREDCAGNGGCCGRSCGCCLKRPTRSDRLLGVGHCSEMCDCCVRESELKSLHLRGVKELEKPARLLKTINERRQGNISSYERTLAITMALGLESGTRQSPFELIDERVQVKLPFGSLDPPPGYT